MLRRRTGIAGISTSRDLLSVGWVTVIHKCYIYTLPPARAWEYVLDYLNANHDEKLGSFKRDYIDHLFLPHSLNHVIFKPYMD
jgi:hypothetical protein